MKPSFKLVEVLGPGPRGFVRCLLVEGRTSLLLVEVGLGSLDRAAPVHRLGLLHAPLVRGSKLQTLRQQLVTAGYRPDDVTDIFVSHLHVHESGGLFDFPTARVHGLKSALEPSAPRLQRLLPEPNRWTVPQEAPRLLYDLRTYPFAFEELELTIVELPGSLDGHAGLLMPYHDGQLFHVGHAVQSLDELTLPLSTTRDAWSILAASKPFTDLETLTKLRRLYHKENLLFVSSGGGRAQLPSVRSSLPELPFLQSPIHG